MVSAPPPGLSADTRAPSGNAPTTNHQGGSVLPEVHVAGLCGRCSLFVTGRMLPRASEERPDMRSPNEVIMPVHHIDLP